VSTTIDGLSALRASMNDLVGAIESEESPLGETEYSEVSFAASGFRRCFRSPAYFETVRAALSIRSATSLGWET
jgi:hypothetical protein